MDYYLNEFLQYFPKDALFDKNPKLFQETLRVYNFFVKNNYNTILAYDRDTMVPIDLESINPDIVFFQ